MVSQPRSSDRFEYAAFLRGWWVKSLALLWLVTPTIVAAQNIAKVSPTGEVNPAGDFVQRVPVDVPIFHGLEPTIGLIYDSSFRDGPLGRGWKLLGDSTIERVSRRTGLPHLDNTDDFLLDGMRLVPCHEQSLLGSNLTLLGASCSLGGSHGLERETFQRVKREGNTWIVWERNGVMSRYLPAQSSKLQPLRWYLDSRTDTHGNRLDYHRWCDGNDECYLMDIEYQDATQSDLRSRIEYRWELRPNDITYAVGSSDLVHLRYRLHSLVVWTNGQVRSALKTSYRTNLQGRWRDTSSIGEITRYGSDVVFDSSGYVIGGTHLPPERFAGLSGSVATDTTAKVLTVATSPAATSSAWSPWTFPTTVPTPGAPGKQQWIALDINGDGLDDIIGASCGGPGGASCNGTFIGNTELLVYVNRGDNTFRPPVSLYTNWAYWFPPPTTIDRGQLFTAGDFNGDGLKDLLAIWAENSGQVSAQIAFGSGDVRLLRLGAVVPMPVTSWDANHRWLVGDHDGDGRDDLVVVEQRLSNPGCVQSRFCTFPQIHVLRSDGSSLSEIRQGSPYDGQDLADPAVYQNVNWTHSPDESPYWFLGDINGDGRADILRVESVLGQQGRTARIGIARSNGSGWFSFTTFNTQIGWEPVVFPSRFGWRPVGVDLVKIGDFDGNGLTDILVFDAWSETSDIPFIHLRVNMLMSQGDGLANPFAIKEQHLKISDLRNNNFSGAGASYANMTSFPNKWFATDVTRDGVTDLVLVTAPSVNGPWPQLTQILTLVSKRDGTFQEPEVRSTAVSFSCWDTLADGQLADCAGGPMFDVMPAELNGDQASDLLFAHLVTASDLVEFTGVPASDTDDPALGLRLGDVSGDGRLDLIHLRAIGDKVQVQTVITSESGASPTPVLQEIPTLGVPLAGIDLARWRMGDFGSPTGTEADGRADLRYTRIDLAGNGPGLVKSLTLFSNGDGTYTARLDPSISVTTPANSMWSQGDFDGDGRVDLIRVLSRESGFEVEGTTLRVPVNIAIAAFQVADLDGDGLSDLLTVDKTLSDTGAETDSVVALVASGAGAFRFKQWPLPAAAFGTPTRSWRIADLNGDGKIDLVSALPDAAGNIRVIGLLFTGSAWVVQDQHLASLLAPPTQATRVGDFNGDGCSDLAWKYTVGTTTSLVRWLLNRCDGQLEFSETPAPLDSWAVSYQSADLDGNGREELLTVRITAQHEVTVTPYDSGESAGLLGGVDNGIGFSLGIEYGTTAGTFAPTKFGRTQYVARTLRFGAMSASPGFASTYSYAGARWSGTRDFTGFEAITVVSRDAGSLTINHRVVTQYRQTAGCAMQPRRTEVRSTTGLYWADTVTYYDTSTFLTDPTMPFTTAPWLCQVERTARSECELTTSCREKLVQVRHYDRFGNLILLEGIGNPLDTKDDRSVLTSFLPPNATNYLVSLPFEIETRDDAGNRVADTHIFYDGTTSHTAATTVGDATRTEDWDPLIGTLTTERSFDTFGNVTAVIDADGRRTSTDWDPIFARFPIRDCNVRHCATHDWDLVLGTKTIETDANGRQARSTFDPLGRHRRTDFPDGGCLAHDYLQWGAQSNAFDFRQQRILETRCAPGSSRDVAVGPWHATYFDGLQRTWREVRSGDYERQFTFNGWKSNPMSESAWMALGGKRIVTRFFYDDAQRLVRVELPDKEQLLKSYEVGTVVENSPTGGVRRTVRDGWDRVSSVTDDVSVGGTRVAATATYGYDVLDHLVSATDANGRVTSWLWSPLGWQRSECRPDTGCKMRDLSRTGLTKLERDALGQRVEYDYDDLGRIGERRQYNMAGDLLETTNWTYDRKPRSLPILTEDLLLPRGPFFRPNNLMRPQVDLLREPNLIGRLVEVSSTRGTKEEFSYDMMGRITHRHVCITTDCVSLQFGWSILGNLDSVIYPDSGGNISTNSETVHYLYDDANRVRQIDPYVSQVSYEPDDRVQVLTFQNGVMQSFSYDPGRRWVDSMRVLGPPAGAQPLISEWNYHYYADGFLKDELRRGLIATQRVFRYDPAGRLLESRGGTWFTYDYDVVGNILHRNGSAFVYGDSAHPNAVTQAGTTTIAYDANGNAVDRNGFVITWDPLRRMLQAETASGPVNYLYTSDGSVARRSHNGDITEYFGPYVEKLPDGTFAFNYLMGDTPVARREIATGLRFLHHDRLGSVTEVTDDKGAVAELYQYDPWGKPIPWSSINNEFRFATGRQDLDTQLLRMGVRSLDPEIGRFITPDPIAPNPYHQINLNPYVYARNSPLNTTDPSGLAPPDELSDSKLSEYIQALKDVLNLTLKKSVAIVRGINKEETVKPTPKDPRDALTTISYLSSYAIRQVYGPVSGGEGPIASKGAQVGFGGSACLLVCFGLFDLQVGVYSGREDPAVTPYFSFGWAFLGMSEGPDPTHNMGGGNNDSLLPNGLRIAPGFSFGGGADAQVFISDTKNFDEYRGYSWNTAASIGPLNGGLSTNSADQKSVYLGIGGGGPRSSWPVGVTMFGSRTWAFTPSH